MRQSPCSLEFSEEAQKIFRACPENSLKAKSGEQFSKGLKHQFASCLKMIPTWTEKTEAIWKR